MVGGGMLYRSGGFIGGISSELIEEIHEAKDTVKQTATDSTNDVYELLFSGTADNTTRTEEVRKTTNLLYNPSAKKIYMYDGDNHETVRIGSNVESDYSGGFVLVRDTDNKYMLLDSDSLSSSDELNLNTYEGVHVWYSYGNAHGYLYCGDVIKGDTDDTWDGTNTSLYDALADKAAADHNHNSTYVRKVGDTMTGTLTFSTTNGIAYQGTNATYNMIKFKDNNIDTYGNGIIIGGGGLVVIGGGESADAVAGTHTSGGDETLDLASDGGVNIWTNVQSGATHTDVRKFQFQTNGTLLTTDAKGGSWNKARDNAFIRSHGFANQGSYYPAISWLHQGGNWSIGSLGNSNYLYLSHIRDTEYSGNNNADNYYLAPPADGNSHSYAIAHSGNVGTGDSNGQVKIAGTNVGVKGWTNFLPLAGGTMTGGITCATSGANLKWGNITIYGGGSNGGVNSILLGDDVTLGDCNVGGCFGMKSTGTNAGFRFYNSSGGLIGGLQSTNGTLQWFNSSGTAYNVYHTGNKPTYSDVGAAAASHTHSYLPLSGGTLTNNLTLSAGSCYVSNGGLYVTKTGGEAQIVCKNGTANKQIYMYANTGGEVGMYSSYEYILRKDSNKKEYLYGATYYVDNAANFRSAIGAAASSSRLTKTDIQDMTEEEARKILTLDVKSFKYKDGFVVDADKHNRDYGIIAEDVMNSIPSVVSIPPEYDVDKFDENEGLGQPLMTVNYASFVPYILKVLQMQQAEIEKLKAR